jgi:hypothetical protein
MPQATRAHTPKPWARTDAAAEGEAACEAERHAFERMGVYKVVPPPNDHKVVESKWVFRIKRGPDGAIQITRHVSYTGFHVHPN